MNALPTIFRNTERERSRIGLAAWVAAAVSVLRQIGPYAAIEIVLPGGTLIALLLWLYRRHRAGHSLMPIRI